MLRQATEFRDANTRHAETYEEVKIIGEKRGFVVAPWDGTEQTEQRIKDDTKATIRLPPSTGRKARTSSPAGRVRPPSLPALTRLYARRVGDERGRETRQI
jgi:hypothetical protein